MIVKIKTDHIRLDQLLKFAAIVDSGGLAKHLIRDGFVYLNGTTCTQRGKKIFSGDLVEVIIAKEGIHERVEVVLEEK
ncbi:MAG TPA: RNA-binding S4 domain-containing protein [Clostridia bacterium]|nr:RNA-binding S4 domain-containing protein [Clostridia bacterium]